MSMKFVILVLYNFLVLQSLFNEILQCLEKYGYDKFNHYYNVSLILLRAFLGVGNFTKVVRACADRQSSDLRLPKV
jgi:hypothetical protein